MNADDLPTLSGAPTATLLPLYCHPEEHPHVWDAVAALASFPAALATLPAARPGPVSAGGLTVVVNVDNGPGEFRNHAYATATARLAAAGVDLLGYVDCGRATRPLAAILTDIRSWIVYPVAGIFLDNAPTEATDAGLVALAVRVAHRAGLARVTANPGAPVDPVYRDIDAALCTFEGDWTSYSNWDGTGSQPGDGHLVYDVPPSRVDAARRLMAAYGAGFGLVTERDATAPYAGLPAWCDAGMEVAR